MAKRLILVIEDEAAIRRGLVDALAGHGYDRLGDPGDGTELILELASRMDTDPRRGTSWGLEESKIRVISPFTRGGPVVIRNMFQVSADSPGGGGSWL